MLIYEISNEFEVNLLLVTKSVIKFSLIKIFCNKGFITSISVYAFPNKDGCTAALKFFDC